MDMHWMYARTSSVIELPKLDSALKIDRISTHSTRAALKMFAYLWHLCQHSIADVVESCAVDSPDIVTSVDKIELMGDRIQRRIGPNDILQL